MDTESTKEEDDHRLDAILCNLTAVSTAEYEEMDLDEHPTFEEPADSAACHDLVGVLVLWQFPAGVICDVGQQVLTTRPLSGALLAEMDSQQDLRKSVRKVKLPTGPAYDCGHVVPTRTDTDHTAQP